MTYSLWPRRLLLLTVPFVLLTALFAPSASAHISTTADGAAPGSTDAVITFRVPNEEANASTVGWRLRLPVDTPIASVLVLGQPGWSFTKKTARLDKRIVTDDGEITEAVVEIDWTAQDSGPIGPGEFGEFTLIAGKLPNTPTIVFKAIQSYSNGETVSWIQTSAPGSNVEPEYPAPTLTLAAAGERAGANQSTPSAQATNVSDAGTPTLSIVATVLGAAALAVALVAVIVGFRRRGAEPIEPT